MKRSAYGEVVVTTDSRLAEQILRYATLLAGRGAADTITFPGRVADGPVEAVSMVIGPASQITAWETKGEFDADTGPAVEDLDRRVRALSADIQAVGDDGPPDVDGFEELEGPTGS